MFLSKVSSELKAHLALVLFVSKARTSDNELKDGIIKCLNMVNSMSKPDAKEFINSVHDYLKMREKAWQKEVLNLHSDIQVSTVSNQEKFMQMAIPFEDLDDDFDEEEEQEKAKKTKSKRSGKSNITSLTVVPTTATNMAVSG